jgi:hypothetical protein
MVEEEEEVRAVAVAVAEAVAEAIPKAVVLGVAGPSSFVLP